MSFGLGITVGLCFLLFAILAASAPLWQLRRIDEIVREWAKRNDYQVLSRQPCILSRGPFWWTIATGAPVFRVSVASLTNGERRTGWLFCGSPVLGLLRNEVRVQWDR